MAMILSMQPEPTYLKASFKHEDTNLFDKSMPRYIKHVYLSRNTSFNR